MNGVFRNEKKYLINVADFMRKSAYLNNFLSQDPHNGTNGYMIRSLYFDTVYDTDFFEKEAGIEIRRKIRLRIYDPAQDYAMLEMKQKQGENVLKRSLKIDRHDAYRLIGCDFSPLLFYKEDFAKELYGLLTCRCYRPKIIVEYTRKAFIAKENNIRITFDSHIISTESNLDLFSTSLPMRPVLDNFYVILEVKYNGFLLGYIKQMLNTTDRSELSVSKYCLARQHND